VYMPVVIPALRSLGTFELVQSHAYLSNEGAARRDRDGRRLAHLPLTGHNATGIWWSIGDLSGKDG